MTRLEDFSNKMIDKAETYKEIWGALSFKQKAVIAGLIGVGILAMIVGGAMILGCLY